MAELLVAEKHARGLIRLLKEYAGKLEDLLRERERVSNNVDRSTLLPSVAKRVESVRPALLNLTREASGLAEQGDVRDLDRLELRLRLAEVEGLLQLFGKG